MNRKLIFILFVLNALITFKVSGQKEAYFLPFIDSAAQVKLVGYKNQSGETVIPAKYPLLFYIDTLREINHSQITVPNVIALKQTGSEYFKPFILSKEPAYPEKGLQRFEKAGKMGFIDSKSKVVVPATYDFVTPFNQGIAEFYTGVEKINVHGCWYWGGEMQKHGYITSDGLEYTSREFQFYESGEVKQVAYRWTEPASCRSRIKTITYTEDGKVQGHYLYGTKPDCSQEYQSKYLFNTFGDTVHSENETVNGLNGLFRLAHADYYYDGPTRIDDWFIISSQWKNDTLLDFISTDLVFLDENYHRIPEKKMIRRINTKKLDWTYTYLPQQPRDKNDQSITFMIHPETENPKDGERLEKARGKLLENWVSHPMNRLIYYSDSMSMAQVGDLKLYSTEINLSERESGKLVRLFKKQGEFESTIEKTAEYSTRLTSYNGDKAPTIVWIAPGSGRICVETGGNDVVLVKSTPAIKRFAKKLVKKVVSENNELN